MAVDEEVEGKNEREVKTQKKVEDSSASLPRGPPPSWEEWKRTSFSQAGGAEEVRASSSAREPMLSHIML